MEAKRDSGTVKCRSQIGGSGRQSQSKGTHS
jgi:hypothetical protein